MRLPKSQISQEFARINQQGRAFKAAEAKLEHVAVCLIGYEGRAPRHFGDNAGVWPIRVATTTKPRDIAKRADLENPIHKVRVHDLVWTQSEAHAKRLKAQLDKLLLGVGEESAALRHNWRDCDDPAVVWAILLEEALRELRKKERIEVFDEEERVRRVETSALKSRR